MSLTINQKESFIDFLNYAKTKFSPLGTKKRLFIDGEFDSNQTKYERKSNCGKIGVVASCEIEAKVLLVFLRIIIDKNWKYFSNVFDKESLNDKNLEGPKNLRFYKKTLCRIALWGFSYVEWYLPGESIHIELEGFNKKGIIDTTYEQVDKWDFDRIKTTIENLKMHN